MDNKCATFKEGIQDYVNDYKLNLIVPKEIKDFNKFSTELGKILKFISVSDDEEEIKRIQFDKSFKMISNEAVNLLNLCTGSDINLKAEGGREESMCKGLDDMKRTERERKTVEIVHNMLKAGKYSDEEIMMLTNITSEQLKEYKGRRRTMGRSRIMENERLKITVNDMGAELYSIYDKENEREIIWPAEPIYWKRHAPVLFPNVGKTYPGTIRYNGKTYPTKQHGFARDMEFDYVDGTEDRIAHLLVSDDKTMENYPFEFGLKVIHELKENELHIKWLVENTGEDTMYFTIGGHPAFQVPADNWKNEDVRIDRQENYFLTFEKDKKELEYVLLDPDSGTAKAEEKYKLLLEDGQCLIGTDRFDNDALIFDNMQIEKAGIAFPDGTPYVTLECKGFPNFGIWQAPKAPFICLEPWWGRCDNHGFDGSIDEKPGIIKVEAGETFEAAYKIIVE